MEFSKVIIANLALLTMAELLDIKEALDEAIATNDIRPEVVKVYNDEGKIYCVKFIMLKTGWSLGESLKYFKSKIE